MVEPKVVRCTIEMELEYGRDFQPDSDDEDVVRESAGDAFADIILSQSEAGLRDYIQTKIVYPIS